MNCEQLVFARQYTGGRLAFATADAHNIFKNVLLELQKNNKVILSFVDLEAITPKFLRESVGRIVRAARKLSLSHNFKIKDLNSHGQLLLNRLMNEDLMTEVVEKKQPHYQSFVVSNEKSLGVNDLSSKTSFEFYREIV